MVETLNLDFEVQIVVVMAIWMLIGVRFLPKLRTSNESDATHINVMTLPVITERKKINIL